MHNRRKTPHQFKPTSSPRSKRWTQNDDRRNPNAPGSAQRSYERYLALAQTEAQAGNIVGAEYYYQHAEHYFRTMSRDRKRTS
jgi:hypothetical protein